MQYLTPFKLQAMEAMEAAGHGGCHRILIIDDMVVVNQITKAAGFKTW